MINFSLETKTFLFGGLSVNDNPQDLDALFNVHMFSLALLLISTRNLVVRTLSLFFLFLLFFRCADVPNLKKWEDFRPTQYLLLVVCNIIDILFVNIFRAKSIQFNVWFLRRIFFFLC